MELIIDTSVLVDSLRGSTQSAEYLGQIRRTGHPVIHPVVEAELVAGARNRRELKLVERMLSRFDRVELDAIDARLSLRLLKRHRLSDGVSWEDCLLAATGLRRGAVLVTLNCKHFRAFRGLRVQDPY